MTGTLTVNGLIINHWPVSARRWFKGPKVQDTPEELAAVERELTT